MNLICRTCGTELLNGVSFCRKCGAAVNPNAVLDSSELPTSILPKTNSTATHRLDARPTSEPQRLAHPDAATGGRPGRKVWKPVLALTVVGAVILTLLTAVAITRIRSHSSTTSADNLVYPGAQTLMDISNPDGGRALQLQTSDPLDKVENWYDRNLRPQKIIRLTSSSVVLKNENTTATIASEGGMTNILIKVIEK
jgi:hypothetical protein